MGAFQADAFQNNAFEVQILSEGGAFQGDAFQANAFQVAAVSAGMTGPVGTLTATGTVEIAEAPAVEHGGWSFTGNGYPPLPLPEVPATITATARLSGPAGSLAATLKQQNRAAAVLVGPVGSLKATGTVDFISDEELIALLLAA